MFVRVLLFFILFILCNNKTDYYKIPLYSNKNFNAVIEIPAGTNKKYEYKNEMEEFNKELNKEFKPKGLAIANLKHNQKLIKQELKELTQQFKIKDITVIDDEPIKQTLIPEINIWTKTQTSLKKTPNKFQGKSKFTISRSSTPKSSFPLINNIAINYRNNYETSNIAKKRNDHFIGLRIQGVYPDRGDTVFDLKKGIVKGVKKSRRI